MVTQIKKIIRDKGCLNQMELEKLNTLVLGALRNITGEYSILGKFQNVAKYLFEGGVLTPPCEIDDHLWLIEDKIICYHRNTKEWHYEKTIFEVQVRSISIFCNSKKIWTKKVGVCIVENGKPIDRQRSIDWSNFGKIIFSSKADAQKVLEKIKTNAKGT